MSVYLVPNKPLYGVSVAKKTTYIKLRDYKTADDAHAAALALESKLKAEHLKDHPSSSFKHDFKSGSPTSHVRGLCYVVKQVRDYRVIRVQVLVHVNGKPKTKSKTVKTYHMFTLVWAELAGVAAELHGLKEPMAGWTESPITEAEFKALTLP